MRVWGNDFIYVGEDLKRPCVWDPAVYHSLLYEKQFATLWRNSLAKCWTTKPNNLFWFSKMFVLIEMLVDVFQTKNYWVNISEGWLLIFDCVYSMKIFWENVCNNCCNWCWYREPAVSLRYCHLVYPPWSWTQVRACRCPRPPVVVWTAPAHSLRHHQETLHPSLPYKCEWVSSNAGWASNLTLAQSSLFTFFSWDT